MKSLGEVKRAYILKVLDRCKGDVAEAAKILGVTKRTIWNNTSRSDRWTAEEKAVVPVPEKLAQRFGKCRTDSDRIWVALEYYRGDRVQAAKVLQMNLRSITRRQEWPKPQLKEPETLPVLAVGIKTRSNF